MRSILRATAALVLAGACVTGCAYGGIAAVDDDTVVIARNDGFLFGLLRAVYVCQVSDSGLTDCSEGTSP